MKTRLKVLETALTIESNITLVLAYLLDISVEDSKTLSNKSSAISFKTKIDLLTDIRALDREEVKKFEYFSSIRNQFVHNISAENFESCFSFIDGLENKLYKIYVPDKVLAHETQLEVCFDLLVKDLLNSLDNLLEAIRKKGTAYGENRAREVLLECFKEVAAQFDQGAQIIDLTVQKAKEKLFSNNTIH